MRMKSWRFFSPDDGGGAVEVVEQAPASEPEVTIQEAEPGPVPYSRFREVNEKASEAARRAEEAERRARQIEDAAARREQMLLERFTVQPAEPQFDDPIEEIRHELAKSRQELAATRKTTEGRLAQSDIDRAVSGRTFLDPDGVKERLAERFFLAQAQGRPFNAEAEAKVLHEREQQALQGKKIAWAAEKREAGKAARSVVTAPSPPPAEAPKPVPKWGTPERRAWDEEQTRSVLAEFRQ